MGGACSTYGELRGSCTGSVGMPVGKRPLGSRRSRWEDNFKMELPGKNWGCGLIWLRIERAMASFQHETSGFHTIWAISRRTEKLSFSQHTAPYRL